MHSTPAARMERTKASIEEIDAVLPHELTRRLGMMPRFT
jgi:hypothetical protein